MTTTLKGFAVKNPLTVVGGIVCLFLFGVTAVVVLAVAGQGLSENARLIVIGSIFSALSAAVPGLLALYKSEATQHDIRNGVVKDKVVEALEEHQVVTRNGPIVTQSLAATETAMKALTKLLETNTAATIENTEATREDNGNG